MAGKCWTILVFLFINSMCYAQFSKKTWIIYYGSTQFENSKFGIYHEAQVQDHILVGGKYNILPEITAMLSFGIVHSDIIGTSQNPYNENQIVQEISYAESIGKLKLKNRIRVEERFLDKGDFNVRGRYYLNVDMPLTSKGFDKNGFYVSVYDEVFANLSTKKLSKLFERNRVYAGMGFKMTNNIGWQIGILTQKIIEKKSTNQILMSLHHRITW